MQEKPRWEVTYNLCFATDFYSLEFFFLSEFHWQHNYAEPMNGKSEHWTLRS